MLMQCRWFMFVLVLAAVPVSMQMTAAPRAHADDVAYLVNVTVRPGYNFVSADAALGYGRGICGKVAAGRAYADIVTEIGTDFGNADDWHAGYLINQAVNELCPASIWQLRDSAGGYVPAGRP